jgi:hypothetical protein
VSQLDDARFEAAERLFHSFANSNPGFTFERTRQRRPGDSVFGPGSYDYVQVQWWGPRSEWADQMRSLAALAEVAGGYVTGAPRDDGRSHASIAISCDVVEAEALAGQPDVPALEVR